MPFVKILDSPHLRRVIPESSLASLRKLRSQLDELFGAPRVTALFGAKWSTWRELPKVTRSGRVYANINGRLYTEHAIQRMIPKSFGNAPVGLAGRGVPSMVVEEVIQHGRIGGIRVVGSTTRVSKILGDLEVILENGIVISIIRH